MKVKVCPKCSSENKETNESCSSCYSPLADVELTESTKAPMVLPPAPEKSLEPPMAETRQPPQAPPSPYGPPPGPGVRPPGYSPMNRERRAPVRQGSSAGLIVLILILLAGGAAAGWWFFLRAPSPGEVVQQFVAASEDKDAEKAKSLLTKSTLSMPGFAEGFARGKELAAKNPQSGKVEKTRVKILSTVYEGDEKKTAIVTCEPEDKSKVPEGMDSQQELVLVKEDGKWKIDLMTTLQRAFQKQFGKGFKMPKGVPMGP